MITYTPVLTLITVLPATVSYQFDSVVLVPMTATGEDQFGAPMACNPTWTDDSAHTSYAPATGAATDLTPDGAAIAGPYTIEADDGGVIGTATLTITSGAGTAFPATGLYVEKSDPNVIIHWTDGLGASTEWNVYASQDKYDVTNPANLIDTVAGGVYQSTHAAVHNDGLNWFYVVRGFDGAGTESTNSTMGYKVVRDFVYNSDKGNSNYVGIPYEGMYKTASDIVMELEGGIGVDTNTTISQITFWDPSLQAGTLAYYYSPPALPFWPGGWTGNDFNLIPADGVFLTITGDFTWVLNGTSKSVTRDFFVNTDKGNLNYFGLDPGADYAIMEDIVMGLEGGIGVDTNTTISQITFWDASLQAGTLAYYYSPPALPFWPGGWTGNNFATIPLDGVFFTITDDFTWTIDAITPEVP